MSAHASLQVGSKHASGPEMAAAWHIRTISACTVGCHQIMHGQASVHPACMRFGLPMQGHLLLFLHASGLMAWTAGCRHAVQWDAPRVNAVETQLQAEVLLNGQAR